MLSIAPSLQVTMVKHEGSRTVVLGGKQDVAQQYCGSVGGQVLDFRYIDIEIKVNICFIYIDQQLTVVYDNELNPG